MSKLKIGDVTFTFTCDEIKPGEIQLGRIDEAETFKNFCDLAEDPLKVDHKKYSCYNQTDT